MQSCRCCLQLDQSQQQAARPAQTPRKIRVLAARDARRRRTMQSMHEASTKKSPSTFSGRGARFCSGVY
jgi:hypothetical protein